VGEKSLGNDYGDAMITEERRNTSWETERRTGSETLERLSEGEVELPSRIRKRGGEVVSFDRGKIADAIYKAAQSVGGEDRSLADNIASSVELFIAKKNRSRIPSVENVQDAVEKVLIELGHAQTALAYVRYRDKRARIRRMRDGRGREIIDEILTARRETQHETTDLSLFVRTSDETFVEWDRKKIVEALVRETGIERSLAESLSVEVEQQIIVSKIEHLTAPLVRELVDAKLIEYGLEHHRRRHTRLGVPLYDAEQVIAFPNKENANMPHNPEATNLMLAENIKKEFALLEVFSSDVADAHISGDIHLHDLGFVDRPYCSGQSLEYVKKFGLDLPNALSIARPAKHPETLLAHMVKFSAALQGHFAGAIGWDAVNIFFAPFVEGLDDDQMHQMAQMLVFEYSQQAVARGGQAIFSDINIYWEIPKHFETVEAIGPGGEYTGRLYSDYIKSSQRFAWALFDVYAEGDGSGRPFFFPKPLVHITEKFFKTPGHEDFLMHISEVATTKGNTYFVFDRGETAKISECCRLSFKLEQSDLDDARQPWRMRYSALQNVTLNMPRVAYRAGGSDAKLFELLEDVMETAVKAHREKRLFLEKLLDLNQEGPLSLLTMQRDGEPYLRMRRATHLIGLLGLNEMVQAHLGEELHESERAYGLGLKVVAFLDLLCKRFSKREGIRFVLEQSPAESTVYRLAQLDLAHFPEQAKRVVKGEISDSQNNVYYTNSTQFNVSVPMGAIDRVELEGRFHDMIEAGALTHVWLGDSMPSSSSIANFVKKVFRNTRNAQIAFSPEFTACNVCGKVTRGLHEECSYCHSDNVDGITRVTGYFTRTSSWNVGKIAELHDRARSTYGADSVNGVHPPAVGSNGGQKGIHIFGTLQSDLHPDGCARCAQTKRIIGGKLGLPYAFWDVDTPDGLAELSRYNLLGMAEKRLPVIGIDGRFFDNIGLAVRYLKDNGNGNSRK